MLFSSCPGRHSSTIYPPWQHPINPPLPFISTPPPTCTRPPPPSLFPSPSLSDEHWWLKKQHRTIVFARPRGLLCGILTFYQHKLCLILLKIFLCVLAVYLDLFLQRKAKVSQFLRWSFLNNMFWLTLTAFDCSDTSIMRSLMQYRPPGTIVSATQGAENLRFDSSEVAHRTTKPYPSVLHLFWLMLRNFLAVHRVYEAKRTFTRHSATKKQKLIGQGY